MSAEVRENLFYVYCPVSQKQRSQMVGRHQEYLPRQNTDTPCHLSELLHFISCNSSPTNITDL